MLLAIDIGNTNTVLGIFKDEKLLLSRRLVSSHSKTVDEYWVTVKLLCEDAGLDPKDLKATIIGSVVPVFTRNFAGMAEKYLSLNPLIVSSKNNLNLKLKVSKPHTLGADRICNMVAAREKYEPPLVVIDFGTATTFDAVSRKGEYLGGAIAPGIQISAEALYHKTAKLPRIDIRKTTIAIGKSTVASMQAGLYYGYIGLVSNIIKEMKKELGENVKVIGTGGFFSIVFDELESLDYLDSELVLQGLRIIYQINRKQ